MPASLTKFFTQNCPKVATIMDSENVSGGCLQTATDLSKASVPVPNPTLQGLNDSDLTALVVDHTSDAVSHNKGKPPLLSIDAFVQPDAKLENKKSEAPVLFRGMAPLLHPVNNLEMKILPVPSSANSANLNPKSLETSHQDVFLEAVALAQLVENGTNNVSLARVPQTSSLDNEDIEGTDGGEEKHGTVFLDPEPQAIDVWPKKQQPFDGNGQELSPLDDIDLVNGSGDLWNADQKNERSAVYDFLYPSRELLPMIKR
ncbi:hypothetical protein Nepgr_022580 [Nepenthes gracilis]|uniref:Uncharacterized protein n=1 Tax=Nepenthes gracilis TaxID=150966 RepID=A0AAD3T0K0_NEPGR|nr:hypothetical protein Nepgr_022580 [Nepenthes gracilis]